MRPGSAEPPQSERENSYRGVISNVGIPTFKFEAPTTTRDFVGCILSTTGLGGVQDREGSVVVVIVHRTEEFPALFPRLAEIFLVPHFPKHSPPILRPSPSSLAGRESVRLESPELPLCTFLMRF